MKREMPPAIKPIDPVLDRIVVVGTSCAGKTSYSRRLAGILGHRHIELDALHWLPNWVERPGEEFRALVAQAVSAERWIVDGNYSPVRDLIWPKATCVVWLNYGFPRVLGRALRRTIRRAVSGEELYSGNKETLRKAFFDRDSLLLWILTTHRRRRKNYAALRKTNAFPQLCWVEFQTPAQAERFIHRQNLPPQHGDQERTGRTPDF